MEAIDSSGELLVLVETFQPGGPKPGHMVRTWWCSRDVDNAGLHVLLVVVGISVPFVRRLK